MATRSAKIDQKADLIWAIADKLTGVYKPHEYGDVILPLTVIRRFDCILSDTKDAVLQKYDEVKNLPMKDILLRKASKKDFYNTSKYTFERLMDDPDHIEENFREYLNKFSANVRDIVHDMMMDSLKIHTATYIADTYPDFKKRINGADRKSDGCRIRSSYAVGFTKDAGDNSKVVMRKENIRNAFNSPMRPFVLATTSIGQEGLDFHNYCRVIMHWNLPSNPIDVGRILRTFKIKKNVEVTDNGKIII